VTRSGGSHPLCLCWWVGAQSVLALLRCEPCQSSSTRYATSSSKASVSPTPDPDTWRVSELSLNFSSPRIGKPRKYTSYCRSRFGIEPNEGSMSNQQELAEEASRNGSTVMNAAPSACRLLRAYASTLYMKTLHSFETSMNSYHSTRRYGRMGRWIDGQSNINLQIIVLRFI
jgi:hypothetical protein